MAFLSVNLNSEYFARNIESVDLAAEKGGGRPYYQEVHELFTSECKPSLSKKSKNQIRNEPISLKKTIDLIRGHHLTPNLIQILFFKSFREKESWIFKKELFDQMPERFKTSKNINAMIWEAGKFHDLEKVKTLFQLAIEIKRADSTTYNLSIRILGTGREFDKVQNVFDLALKNDKTDGKTYNCYMTAAGNHCQLDEVQRAFDLAITSQKFIVSTFNSYIAVSETFGRFDLAERGFSLALQSEMSDEITFNSYINQLGRAGKTEEMRSVYQAAITKGQAKDSTHMTYLHWLVLQGYEEEAELLFRNLGFPIPEKTREGSLLFDLHGFSYGAGFLVLKQIIANRDDLKSFGLIHGKGSLEDGNYLQFRDFLISKVEECFSNWNYEAHPSNEGLLMLQKKETYSLYEDPDFLKEMEIGAFLWKKAQEKAV